MRKSQTTKLSFAAIRGVLPRPAKAQSVETMNEAVIESAATRFKSFLGQKAMIELLGKIDSPPTTTMKRQRNAAQGVKRRTGRA